MEAVELCRAPCGEGRFALRFPDGEEVYVDEATLLRSPIVSNVISVVEEGEGDSGVIRAPSAQLLRSWLRFVQPIHEEVEEERQPPNQLDNSGYLVLALKVLLSCYVPWCMV